MLQYEEKGADLSVTGAQQENIADFVADMLFNDESGMDRLLSELDKPTRNKFIQWILDIINELKSLFPGNSKQLREIKALEGKFRNLLTETKTVEIKDAGTSKDSNYSLSPTKVKRLEQIINNLGDKNIKLNAKGKTLTICTDKFTKNKAIFSKKGRTEAEVNARIKAIPYFEDILKDAKFREKDTQIRDLDKDAKKGVTAIYHFDSKYDKYDIDIVIREKANKHYLYEVKFIDPKNKKSSRRSITEESVFPASNNEDDASNHNLPQNKPSVKQFSLEEETQNSPESNVKYSYNDRQDTPPNIDKKNVVFAEKETFISVDMDENQRYEILKDKKIQLQEIEVDKNFDIEVDFLENNIKSIVEKPLISKLQELGCLKKYTSNAIDVEFEFTGKGARKSIHSQENYYGGNLGDFAKVVLNMQKLLDNSVLLEIHTDKGKGTPRENSRLVQTYVLLSAFKENNSIKPVQFEVKQYVDNNNRLYLAVALTKIETGVKGNTALHNKVRTSLVPISDISISDLFKNVNVKDAKFLKYAPNQFLNEEQIKAKEKELEKDREKYSKSSDNATQIFNPEDISFSLEESEIVSDYADRVDELSRQLRNQEITPEEYKKSIDELFAEAGKKHGTIKQGESVTGEEDFSNPVPKSVGKGTEIRQYIRTVMEAKCG